MQHIQQLMKVHDMKELSEAISTMDICIVPRVNGAVNWEIPKYTSSELSRAKLKKSKVIKSKEAKYLEGAISRNKYQTGDFVSMDQYIVKTPGCL